MRRRDAPDASALPQGWARRLRAQRPRALPGMAGRPTRCQLSASPPRTLPMPRPLHLRLALAIVAFVPAPSPWRGCARTGRTAAGHDARRLRAGFDAGGPATPGAPREVSLRRRPRAPEPLRPRHRPPITRRDDGRDGPADDGEPERRLGRAARRAGAKRAGDVSGTLRAVRQHRLVRGQRAGVRRLRGSRARARRAGRRRSRPQDLREPRDGHVLGRLVPRPDRRPAPRPDLGEGGRARHPGADPHRRAGRLLPAGGPRERALPGAGAVSCPDASVEQVPSLRFARRRAAPDVQAARAHHVHQRAPLVARPRPRASAARSTASRTCTSRSPPRSTRSGGSRARDASSS